MPGGANHQFEMRYPALGQSRDTSLTSLSLKGMPTHVQRSSLLPWSDISWSEDLWPWSKPLRIESTGALAGGADRTPIHFVLQTVAVYARLCTESFTLGYDPKFNRPNHHFMSGRNILMLACNQS